MSKRKFFHLVFVLCAYFEFCALVFGFFSDAYAQAHKDSIIINGDTVEYSTEKNEATAVGNIVINYKGATLTCDKLTINTLTKEGVAEGNAKLEDVRGVITGSKITYNFNTKAGIIVDAGFRANPYFGRADKIEKVNDKEFISLNGYMSTCNYDHPHYRIQSKKIDFFPQDKVRAKGISFLFGKVPILYLPGFSHSLVQGKDTMSNIEVSPGSRKEWGYYLLTAWRWDLTNNVTGRIYLDYRTKLGLSEGFGFNYKTPFTGKGDFKFYYTDEHPSAHPLQGPDQFQRYLARWRHQWDIDPRTNLTFEYYGISDNERKYPGSAANFLKDYFYREFELYSQPLSYILLHHSFSYSSIDLLFQKNTNHWFNNLETLPQLRYNLPSIRVGNTPFYFENNTSFANFNKSPTTPPVTTDDVKVSRFDMFNKISLPMKAAFVEFDPFVANRETIYDKGLDGDSLPKRSVFYSGADLSTKFYRILNVKSNLLGMDIDGLRHIITPLVHYSFNPEPTISSSKLKQIDPIDAIKRDESVAFELSNKLQTKRNGQSVDLVNVRLDSIYRVRSKDPSVGKGFSDFLVDIECLPYSWMSFKTDATYGYKEGYFKEINVGLSTTFGTDRSFDIGNRYLRSGGKEMTSQFLWRLNPKWKFKIYERYQFAQSQGSGLKEQEYTATRDLHCWEMDISLNVNKDSGQTIWCIFRLKAFPGLHFGFEQSYHPDRSGSQSNP